MNKLANLKIEHRIARGNLGVSDDQHAMEYVARLSNELRTEYRLNPFFFRSVFQSIIRNVSVGYVTS